MPAPGDEKIEVDPGLVAALGNEMLSVSSRLRPKLSAVGTSEIRSSLGRPGEGSAVGSTYAAVVQAAADTCEALCGAVETNGQYVLLAAQNADDAFN